MKWKLIFSRQAVKDVKKLKEAGLSKKVSELLEILREDPFKQPPAYGKLLGDMLGMYSRRINVKHRLVYEVFEKDRLIKIYRMWSHYE